MGVRVVHHTRSLWIFLVVMCLLATHLGAVESASGEALFKQAQAAPGPEQDALVQKAAAAGSIQAAARMIILWQSDALGKLDPEQTAIKAWQEVEGTFEGMTGKQIYGVIFSRYVNKSKSTDQQKVVGYVRARELIESSPVNQPILKYYQSELWSTMLPPEQRDMEKRRSLLIAVEKELTEGYERQEPRVKIEWLGLLGLLHRWAIVFGVDELEDNAKARANYQQAAAIARDLKLPEREGNMLQNQALCAVPQTGDWTEAISLVSDSAKAYGTAGLKVEQARSLILEAGFRKPNERIKRKGDWVKVDELYTEAARLRAEAGDIAGQADALYQLAIVFTSDDHPGDQWPKATKLFAESAKLFAQLRNKEMQGKSLSWQAIAHTGWDATKKDDASRALALQAAAILREAGKEELALEADNWAK